jgi:hypothetical protein
VSRPARPALVGLASAVLLAAGCGGSSRKPYTAAGTAQCLRGKGFTHVTTAADKVGFVAAFAKNGGLRAASPSGNTVTIAFAADEGTVAATEKAFREYATGVYKRHIRDVMSSDGNAVVVWTTTPASGDLSTVQGCLGS